MKRAIILSILFIIFVQSSFAQRFNNKKIVGYVSSWGNQTNVNFNNLTHAMFAFIIPSANGDIVAQNAGELTAMNSFLNSANAAGTIKYISVGSTNFATMANNAAARDKFADTLKKFCQHWGFDGVDIDWEGIQTANDRDNFTNVMTVLESVLKPANLGLVATIGFGSYWGQWYPDAGLAKADWLQIMVYDQTGTWSGSPFGNHSTFSHLLQAESYWVGRGYTRDKLVMGVPFYGYKFASTSGGLGAARLYKDIIVQFPNMTDDINQTPGTDYTFFNGPALIRQKSQYLLDQNFAGVMIWEMCHDAAGDRSLHEQIVCIFSNTNTCRINMPLAIKDAEALKGFDLYIHNENLAVNAKIQGEAKFYFYDYSGKLMNETPSIYLNEGLNSVQMPDSVRGFFICKVIMGDQYYSEKLYK